MMMTIRSQQLLVASFLHIAIIIMIIMILPHLKAPWVLDHAAQRRQPGPCGAHTADLVAVGIFGGMSNLSSGAVDSTKWLSHVEVNVLHVPTADRNFWPDSVNGWTSESGKNTWTFTQLKILWMVAFKPHGLIWKLGDEPPQLVF